MKRKLIFVGAVLWGLVAGQPARAVTSRVGSAEDIGFGFALGQPLGITGKYWLSSTTALDAVAGYHFNKNFDMHADYLWHTFSSFDIQDGRLPFYFGVGGRVNFGNDSNFGMRLPIGASYLPSNQPYEVFAEVAPVVRLLKNLGVDIDGIIGVRVYLNYLK